MKFLSHAILGSLGFLFAVELMSVGPQIAMAGADPSPQTSSGGIEERGLPQVAPGIGGGTLELPPTVLDPTGFKCSSHTGRCNCSGAADCTYMKDLLTNKCGKITCTGSGSTQKCQCTITGY